ncbi:MAG: tandem-95 repeat protein [Rhizobiales bacterium]|nr:tandem-95 repeat protein [Hyphomicrobiales bacterium]
MTAPLGTLTAFVTDGATGVGDTGTVQWTYTVDNTALQYLGEGDTRVETFNLILFDSGGQQVTQTITITLTGANDAPSITGAVATGAATEVAGDSSAQNLDPITGSLTVSDADVGDVLTGEIVGDPVVKIGTTTITLPAGAEPLTAAGALSFGAATTNGSSTTLGWTYDPGAADLDFLAAGEQLTITYTVRVSDGTTTTGTQNIVITITGTNDGPVSTGGVVDGALAETAASTGAQTLAATGSFTATDLDASDTLTAAAGSPTATWSNMTSTESMAGVIAALSQSLTLTPTFDAETNTLTVGWSYDAAVNIDALAAGETITLVYPVTITDSTDATTSRDVTIVITGTNDAPTISAATDVAETFAEAASGTQTLSTTGSFVATDLDRTDTLTAIAGTAMAAWSGGAIPTSAQDQVNALIASGAFGLTPSYDAATNELSIGWTYDITAADLNWLGDGETLTLTFPVTVSDGQGGSVTQTVVITLTGANDAPTISSFAATATNEDASAVSIDLTQGAADVDGDLVFFAIESESVTSSNESREVEYTIEGNSITIDPAQFNDLDADQSETITITYAVTDGTATTPNTVTLLVQGQNDLATITVAPVADVTETDTSAPVTIDIASLVTITDDDAQDEAAPTKYVADSGVVTTASTLSPPSGTLLERVTLANGVVSYDRADFNWLDDGESVTYTVTFDAQSGDDAVQPQSFTFTVTGQNDAPTISAISAGPITEDAANPFSINLLAGAADVDGDTVSFGSLTSVVSSNGARTVAASADANGVLTLDPAQFNDLAIGESETVTVTYTITDGTTPVTNTATFTVQGQNDGPTLVGTIAAPTAYADPTTPLTTAGANSTTDILFAATGSGSQGTRGGTITFTDADATDSLGLGAAAHNGAAVVAADIHAIRAAATFTYTNASGTFTSTGLNANLTPANGTIPTTGALTVGDRADILNAFDINSATYDAATNQLSVVWSFDNTSTGSTGIARITVDNDTTAGLPPTVGSVDADWLAAGETLVVTFPITVSDGHGGEVTANVPITFTGTNDNPTGTQARTLFLNEGGGGARFTNPSTGTLVDNNPASAGADNGFASGTHTVRVDDGTTSDNQAQRISFNDTDRTDVSHSLAATAVATTSGAFGAGGLPSLETALGWLTPSLTQRAAGGNGQINWSFVAPDSAFDYLGAGDTLVLTYQLNVTDGSLSTTGAGRTVTVTVTGQNDGPALAAITPPDAVAESAGDSSTQDIAAISGTLSVDDKDVGDVLTASIVGSPVVKLDGGSYTLPSGASALANALTFAAGASNGGAALVNWTYDPSAVDLDFLAAGETLTLTYTITVNDGTTDTGTQELTISITGTNDAPVITANEGGDSAALGETDEGLGATGELILADADPSDTLSASVASVVLAGANLGGLISADVLGFLTLDPTTGIAGDGAGTPVGWTFNSDLQAFNFLAVGQTLTLTYQVQATDDSGATNNSGTHDVVITITGTNDGPVATNDTAGGTGAEVYETATLTVASGEGVLANDSDVDDAISVTKIAFGETEQTVATGAPGVIAGAYGTLTLNADGSYSYAANANPLALGETAMDTFTYTVTDLAGESTTATLAITVTGQNDTPTLSATTSSGSVDEIVGATGSAVVHTATGSFTVGDVDNGASLTATSALSSHVIAGAVASQAQLDALAALESKFSLSSATPAVDSTLTWTFAPTDADLDFLRNGQTATLVFTITVADSFGGAAEHTVTLTLTGQNDAVSILADGDGAGEVTEDATTPTLSDSGTFQFRDADLSSNFVTVIPGAGNTLGGELTTISALVEGAPADRDVTWTYNLANSATQYLGAGETANETFTVRVLDSVSGGYGDQAVTITVHGANDGPEVTIGEGSAAANVSESNAGLTADGAFTVTDVDLNDAVTASVAGVSTSGTYAGALPSDLESMLSVNASVLAAGAATRSGAVNWNFSSGAQAFDFLAAGETLILTYDVVVADDSGTETSTVHQPVVVTITGTNDGPVANTLDWNAAPFGQPHATEDAAVNGSFTAILPQLATDVDSTLTAASFSIGNVTVDGVAMAAAAAGVSYDTESGAFTFDPTGLALYQSLDNGDTAVVVVNFTVTDDHSATATGAITFRVDGANDGPVANNVDWNTGGAPHATEDAAVNGNFNAILPSLATDVDDTLTAASFAIGTVTVDDVAMTAAEAGVSYDTATGAFTFDPTGLALYQSLNAGDVATVVVAFTATDDNGASSNGSITFRVDGVNDPAVVGGTDAGAVTEDAGVDGSGDLVASGALTIADADAGEASFIAETLTGTAYGSLSIAANGAWTFTVGNAGLNGLDGDDVRTETFTVHALDGTAHSVVVTINGANDAPVANDDPGAATELQTIVGDVLTNDVDPDHDPVVTRASFGEGLPVILGEDGVATIEGAYGTLTIHADGGYSYVANADALQVGEEVQDVFAYTIEDGEEAFDQATLTINVTGQDDAPVITGQTTSAVTEDAGVTGGNLGASGAVTATDPDHDESGFVAGTVEGTYGGLTIDGAGAWTYTADNAQLAIQQLGAGEHLTDTIIVTTNGGVEQQIVITINGANDAPEAGEEIPDQTATEDAAFSYTVPAAAFTDVDATDSLTLSATGLPLWLSFNAATGVFSGTPANGDVGAVTVTITATDGSGAQASQTVVFTVNNVNDAPVATADAVTLAENVGTTLAVSGNDTDADGDALTVAELATLTVADVDGLGALSGADLAKLQGYFTPSGGNIVFAPGAGLPSVESVFDRLEPGQTAVVRLGYTASDGHGGTSSAVATFTINGALETVGATPNDDPALTGTIYGDAIDGLAGDDVINGLDGADTLVGGAGDDTISGGSGDDIITGGAGDDAITGGSGVDTAVYDGAWTDYTITFTPATGAYTITHNASGDVDVVTGVEKFAFGAVTVDVRATGSGAQSIVTGNGPSIVSILDPQTSATVSVDENAAAETLAATVTASDVNLPAGDDLVFALVDGAGAPYTGPFAIVETAPGVAGIRVVGALDREAAASHTLNVRVTDSAGQSVTQAVTVTIGDLNDTAPVITAPASASVAEGATDVLTFSATDADSVGGPATWSLGGADAALFQIVGNQLRFVGAPNFEAPADAGANNVYDVTLIADDGANASQQAVAVTVTDVNEAPVANDGTATVDEDGVVTIDVASLISDVDGDALTITASATNGTVTVAGTVLTFTPAANYHGPATISYTASDGTLTDGGSIDVTVNPVNDAPEAGVALADQSSPEDAAVSFALPEGAFTDVDGETLTLTATLAGGDPLPAWLSFDGAAFTGTPPANFNGALTITVTATDAGEQFASQTFTLDIAPVNDAPVGAGVSVSGDEDTAIAGAVTASDVDGDELSFALGTGPANGTATVNADGTFSYQGNENFHGADSFTVSVSDGAGGFDEVTVDVTVNPVNDAPAAGAALADQSSPEDAAVSFALPEGAFTDVDGEPLTLTATLAGGDPLPAWLSFDGANFTGTPPANFNGALTITVTATDAGEQFASQTFTLDVTPVNDAPVATDDVGAAGENGAVAFDVLGNDADVDEDALAVSGLALDVEATSGLGALSAGDIAAIEACFSVDELGQIAFDPGVGLPGAESVFDRLSPGAVAHVVLTYTVSDGAGGATTASLAIDVTGEAESYLGTTGDDRYLIGSAYADVIDGLAGADVLSGQVGNDWLYGREGADVLRGGAGADHLDGGDGFDYATYDGSSVGVAADLADPGANTGEAAGDQYVSIEGLVGSAQADVLSGDGGANTFIGGLGADTMTGRGGNDAYYVDNAGDKVIEAVGGGTDIVRASVSYVLLGGVEVETLTAANVADLAALNLTGNEFAQRIYGNAGANNINGRGGADLMYGYGGDDIFHVDNAGDRVFETTGGGRDTIKATVDYTLAAGVEIETLATSSNTGVTTLALTGNELAQTVVGDAGGNRVNGRGGSDTLYGLAGEDTFVFDTALGAGNVDRIMDYALADDTIELRQAIFSSLTAGVVDVSKIAVGAAATTVDQRLVYNAATGALFYDADGAGGAAQVQFATLSRNLATTAGDLAAEFKVVV